MDIGAFQFRLSFSTAYNFNQTLSNLPAEVKTVARPIGENDYCDCPNGHDAAEISGPLDIGFTIDLLALSTFGLRANLHLPVFPLTGEVEPPKYLAGPYADGSYIYFQPKAVPVPSFIQLLLRVPDFPLNEKKTWRLFAEFTANPWGNDLVIDKGYRDPSGKDIERGSVTLGRLIAFDAYLGVRHSLGNEEDRVFNNEELLQGFLRVGTGLIVDSEYEARLAPPVSVGLGLAVQYNMEAGILNGPD